MSGAAVIFMLFGMIFLWGGFATALITSSRRGKDYDY